MHVHHTFSTKNHIFEMVPNMQNIKTKRYVYRETIKNNLRTCRSCERYGQKLKYQRYLRFFQTNSLQFHSSAVLSLTTTEY